MEAQQEQLQPAAAGRHELWSPCLRFQNCSPSCCRPWPLLHREELVSTIKSFVKKVYGA